MEDALIVKRGRSRGRVRTQMREMKEEQDDINMGRNTQRVGKRASSSDCECEQPFDHSLPVPAAVSLRLCMLCQLMLDITQVNADPFAVLMALHGMRWELQLAAC